MHVVILGHGFDQTDHKAFASLADAYSCFNRFAPFVGNGGFRSMSIYTVSDAVDAAEAIAVVKDRAVNRMELITLKRSDEIRWIDFPYDIDDQIKRYWSEFHS